MRKEKILSANHVEQNAMKLHQEMNYLMNPMCLLVHTALFIKDYAKRPQALIPLLNTNEGKLAETLQILERNEFLILGSSPFEIREVKPIYPHYGPEHPLMRLHQQLLKSALIQRLSQTSEKTKESFFVTFTMDDETFAEVKKKFRAFLQEVQNLTFDAKHKSVYQMSFDLLKWF